MWPPGVLKAVAVAAVLLGAFVAGHVGGVKAGAARVQRILDAERAGWAAEREAMARNAATASEAARAMETRRAAAIQEVITHAEVVAAQARSDAASSAAAGAGLRQRAATVAARCSGATGNPAAAVPGSAASTPGDLLADVLGRLDEAGRQLAAVADARGAAGAACERSYDALR